MNLGEPRCEPHNNGRILLVEEERPVQEMIVRWLRAAGRNCECALDRNAATAALELRSFDLVITDVCMPGYCDFDFLLQLQAEFPELPVLVLTGCNDPRFATKALTYGAWGYLLKPVPLRDLLSQVNRALERSVHIRASRQTTAV